MKLRLAASVVNKCIDILWSRLFTFILLIGSFRNDDDNVSEDVKNAIDLR